MPIKGYKDLEKDIKKCGKIIYPRIETVSKIASGFGLSVSKFLKYAIDHHEE
jgi:hypothetical protein